MRSLCIFAIVACLVISAASAAQGSIEYLYGVGDDGIYLVQVDQPADQVSSAILFPFDQRHLYGAAASGDGDYFWATSHGDLTYGVGSALHKVYPAERAVIQIGDDYGQNPRYPTNPFYRIRIMELAYDDDADILYGTDYLGLYLIDRTTGQATLVGDFGNGDDGEPIDMVWSMGYDTQTQKLIIVNQKLNEDGMTRLATHMYTVDPATAAVTFVADTTALGMTDVYESHTSSDFFGCSNLPNELFDLNSSTGIATSLGLIADNILGLGADFTEVPGPQVWFRSVGPVNTTATSYSELNGQRDDASQSAQGGWDTVTSTASALSQEAGQDPGIGQQTTMKVSTVSTHDLTSSHFSSSIDFSSLYNGPNEYGTGGGTATLTWESYVQLINDDTYSIGDRVIVLIDGSQTLDDDISNYVLDWELSVYDADTEKSVALLTEENVPLLGSAPFLAAFHAVVEGNSFRYRTTFSLTLDIDMLAGDINADGKVDMIDFALLAGKWLANDCELSNLWCNEADVDESGDVGIEDLAQMAANWLNGNGWDNDNQFDLDLDFVFRSVALPETLHTLNDECADAIVITSDTEYFGSTQTATGTDVSSCGDNDIYDVWYNFVPPQNGLYKVHVKSISSFSPCVSVFDGCGGAELHCWNQNDSERYFDATAETNYSIRLADYGASTGDFKLVVIYYPIPDNDECDGALPVEMYQYYTGQTAGATNDSTSSCGTDDTKDVWYKYTAANDGTAVFTVSPYSYDGPYFTATAFDSCGPEKEELACAVYENTGGGEEDPSTILILENVIQGWTYYIRIARNDFDYGKFSLDVRPGPDNDDCTNAESIDVWCNTGGSTIGATGSDITSCGTDDNRDVWYRLTSSEDQVVLIQVSDYSYSGMTYTVSVFDSCGGAQQACAESGEGGEGTMARLVYGMETGQTIYIRIAYDNDAMGWFDLEVSQTEAPYNDECADAEAVDGGTSGSTLGASGSVQSSCGDNDTHDVWYTFTPETTDTYNIGIYQEEGPFGGTITVYDGDSCDPLPMELGCAQKTPEDWQAEFSLSLTANVTYLIRVASDDAGQGSFSLGTYGGGGGGGE